MITVPNGYFRFCGWMLLAGSVLTTIVQYAHLEDVPSGMGQMSYFVDVAVWTHITLVVAYALFLMGLSGLYLRQSSSLKWWGWLSFGFIFAFYVLDLMHAPLQIFDYPVFFGDVHTEADLAAATETVTRIQSQAGPGMFLMMLLFPLMMLGTLLEGIAMLRARVLSRWPAIATLVSLVFVILPYGPVTKYLFPLPFLIHAWYGGILAFEKQEPAPVPVSAAG